MLERVKQKLVATERELCGSVKVERKNHKSNLLNDDVKAALEDVLGVKDEIMKFIWKFIQRKNMKLKDLLIKVGRGKISSLEVR